jgi:hypothetical protein
MSNNKSMVAAIIELIGGYFGLLGLGWVYGGDLGRGLLILIGYFILLGIGGTLTTLSFGLLGLIFVPLYIVAPIISAIKVYQFVNEKWW